MSAQLDTLVAAEKAANGPSAEARVRIGAKLKAAIAAPPAAVAPAAAPAAAGGKLLLLAGLGAGALLGAGLHAGLAAKPEPVAPPPAPPAVVERARPVDDLAQERRLLELAREAVTRNASSDALAMLSAHRALFPDGQLAEEREALGVQVLVRAGQFDEAKAAGEKFFARYPKGLLAPVVNSALESIPVTGSKATPQ
jgi:hypothetical protein